MLCKCKNIFLSNYYLQPSIILHFKLFEFTENIIIIKTYVWLIHQRHHDQLDSDKRQDDGVASSYYALLPCAHPNCCLSPFRASSVSVSASCAEGSENGPERACNVFKAEAYEGFC